VEKEEKRRRRAAKRKKVGFVGDDDDDGVDRKEKKGKTDKMLDEMGDASKYLAKLRKNRKDHKSKANLLGRGGRKKSMFFKDAKPLLLGVSSMADSPSGGGGKGDDLDL